MPQVSQGGSGIKREGSNPYPVPRMGARPEQYNGGPAALQVTNTGFKLLSSVQRLVSLAIYYANLLQELGPAPPALALGQYSLQPQVRLLHTSHDCLLLFLFHNFAQGGMQQISLDQRRAPGQFGAPGQAAGGMQLQVGFYILITIHRLQISCSTKFSHFFSVLVHQSAWMSRSTWCPPEPGDAPSQAEPAAGGESQQARPAHLQALQCSHRPQHSSGTAHHTSCKTLSSSCFLLLPATQGSRPDQVSSSSNGAREGAELTVGGQ